jgi:hypothetical protein
MFRYVNVIYPETEISDRERAVNDINDSLLKAEIIFLNLTFSSLGLGFGKYTFEKPINFSLSQALNESICLAEQNRLKPPIDHLPVVGVTTLIDAIDCNYRIFLYTIPYHVKRKNNTIEADPSTACVIDIKFNPYSTGWDHAIIYVNSANFLLLFGLFRNDIMLQYIAVSQN